MTTKNDLKQKKFVPKQIGFPNEFKRRRIISVYERMIQAAGELQISYEGCLQKPEGLPIDWFFEAIQTDTTRYIKEKFVEINDVKIPGISTEKLIESDLLDIVEIEEAVELRKAFNKAWEDVQKTDFVYPLRKLYSNENVWELTPEFYKAVDESLTFFTKSQKQNEILELFENLCSTLNKLGAMSIMDPEKGRTELSHLAQYIEPNTFDGVTTFVPHPFLFYRGKVRHFKERGYDIKDKSFQFFVS